MTTATCNGCGRPIRWAKTKNGKNVPLEEVPIVQVDSQGVATATDSRVLVNHFKTCPKAADFTGKGKSS